MMTIFIISKSDVHNNLPHNNLPQYLLKGLFNDKADPRLSIAFKTLSQFAFRGALVEREFGKFLVFTPCVLPLSYAIRKHMINRF